MTRRRWAVGTVIVVCAGAAAVANAVAADDESGPPLPPRLDAAVGQRLEKDQDTLPCTGLNEPANFKLYSLGAEFDGLSLSRVVRRCDNSGSWGSANYVSYIYGDCDPTHGALGKDDSVGCPFPIEVQIWPSCERTLGDYEGDMRPEPIQRRGVTVARVGDWVELYTADSTVVVFGNEFERVVKAAEALQPLSPKTTPATFPPVATSDEARLPAAVDGALSAERKCQ